MNVSKTNICALLLASLFLMSCRGQVTDQPPVHVNPNMDFQDRFNAQEENPFFADGRAMRTPVEGTIARGNLKHDRALYEGVNENGNFIDENPFDMTEAFLYRGKERYDIYCKVCHGGAGDGQGIIMTGQYGYVPAPSYHTELIRSMPDGQIYDAIANGVRTMPSYASQIKTEDRWAIVAYIRALQMSQNVSEEEILEYGVDLSELQADYAEEQARAAERAAALEGASSSGDEVSAELGEALYTQNGCHACHSTDGSTILGPSFQDLYGHDVTLDDGTTVTADDEYLIESIVDPSAKIVDGFNNAMPPFSHLAENETQSIVEFIKTLSDN